MKRILFALILITSSAHAAQITLTIPNDKVEKTVDALCYTNGYKDTITTTRTEESVNEAGETVTIQVVENTPNPVSKADFAKGVVYRYIKQVTNEYYIDKEINAARSAYTKVDFNEA